MPNYRTELHAKNIRPVSGMVASLANIKTHSTDS